MMLRKSMLILAATGAIATAALAPTEAAAMGHPGHFGHPGPRGFHAFHGVHAFHGFHGFHGFHAFHSFHPHPVWGHFHARPFWGHVRYHFAFRYHYRFAWYPHGQHCWFGHCHPHYRIWWWARFHRPLYGPGPVIAAPGVVPPAVPQPTVGCLTKKELASGAALFRDLCTGEAAISTPDGDPPAIPGPVVPGRR